MYKVLVCGDRNWDNYHRIATILDDISMWHDGEIHIIHGGAKGADTLAGEWAKNTGRECTEVVADWKRYGRAAGPIRNKAMLDLNPDLVIAFHSDITKSKGTANMVDQAQKAGHPIFLFTS